MASIFKVEGFSFTFNEPGGPNHLLPGRPLEQTRQLNRPRGAGMMVSLNSISGSFISGGTTLGQRPLGQFMVSTGLRAPNTLVCRVRLTDENMDDAIIIHVSCVVLFFG